MHIQAFAKRILKTFTKGILRSQKLSPSKKAKEPSELKLPTLNARLPLIKNKWNMWHGAQAYLIYSLEN
jgi:hypothetical protein